ncbi:ring-opening amidohydrolase [Lichenibacterium minor]|uniref:Cyanuric acid amidohydrolase n=1 Tax=Lichenibacterium minor TaxID=2316528 RepID=A0A4Q2U2F1_9HYPH|nr:ring-opening amidohydrolase [Lichenibacterium minor]RYC30330.1 ring-opening amidohydrolase [Lichenibacterium minor]
MQRRRAFVHRISTGAPDDVAGLEQAFAEGRIDAGSVVAILGKTEGNGLVNDWTRALAARALRDAIARHAGPKVADEACLVMSGGTEGGLAPHVTVFEVRPDDGPERAGALAIGRARTADLPPEHLGRSSQVGAVAVAVRAAMRDAGILEPDDVHFVQVKCPLLTGERIAEARGRGADCVTSDALKSMGLSRAAASLGVAFALGEVEAVPDTAVGHDLAAFSTRASASAGVELAGHEVVVMGRGRGWSGPLRIDHATMADALDVEPVRAALARLGLAAVGQLAPGQRSRLKAMLAKAEAPSCGRLRGFRHTMLVDSDLSATRHARAFAAGALGSIVGHAEIYVSGGAEHQGPDGGGPVAIIAEEEGEHV